MLEVCHFARGYEGGTKRCRSVAVARARGSGARHALRGGFVDRWGGREGRGEGRRERVPHKAPAVRAPTHASSAGPGWQQQQPPPPPPALAPREKLQSRTHPPPRAGPSPTLGSESARRRRRRRRQKEAPPAKFNPRPSSFPSAFTLEGSCTPNAKPPASCLSLLLTITPYFSLFRVLLLFKGKPGWQTQKKVASGIVKLLAKSGPPHPSRPKLLTSPATPSQGSRPSFPRGPSP